MSARCWDCGESLGRCYEHGGSCGDACVEHDCPMYADVRQVRVVRVTEPDLSW